MNLSLDPVLLSRLQFFWVVSFHILLPAFTIGPCLLHRDARAALSEDQETALTSSFPSSGRRSLPSRSDLGVVSGIVMPFQFGTNWSRFSDIASNVIGPLMAYEGLTAFFLEASFLGVLLFGRKLVPPWAHCFAAVMVAAGRCFPPSGSSRQFLDADARRLRDHRRPFHALDWMEVIFNPSFPYRLAHTSSPPFS